MNKPLVVLGISWVLTACAGTTPSAQTASEECSTIDNNETGSNIRVKQVCRSAGGRVAGAPQR